MKEPDTILLVSSRLDPAGTHIHDAICHELNRNPTHLYSFCHYRSDERLLYWRYDPLFFPENPPDRIIFLSRHASKNPKPVLTVHVTGNFKEADLGGQPRTLTPADPPLMYAVLQNLLQYAPPGYAVSYEVTHHGPTGLPLPSFFVEIGSTETEWNDTIAVHAVAKAVLLAREELVIPMVGFGGTHYATRQTEISFLSRAAFGHIVPSRQIDSIDQDMVRMMTEMTHAEAAYIDKKSLSGEEIKRITALLSQIKLPVLGQTDLFALKHLTLPQYTGIIAMAQREVPDCQVRVQSIDRCLEPVVIRIPSLLLEQADKLDHDNLLASISEMPVATLRKGGKSLLPVFIVDKEDAGIVRHELIHLCISVVLANTDASIDGEILTIRRLKFDPKKAEEFGIPPGPLYTTLLSGKSVLYEGREITPDMVMKTIVTRIEIPVENDA
ncbi:MAG: D-tyrosyl-tRNA(Tyr) deacylase [Methanospirillaceae archaeon]|nr:D-tyrosyl-tRNA(Tyr) deacylase [Methanospirillaceae archaeon]